MPVGGHPVAEGLVVGVALGCRPDAPPGRGPAGEGDLVQVFLDVAALVGGPVLEEDQALAVLAGEDLVDVLDRVGDGWAFSELSVDHVLVVTESSRILA